MKRPSSPRNTGTGVQSSSLSQVLSIIPNLLALLPDDQVDNKLHDADIASLFNFDFRTKSSKKVGSDNKEIKPTTLEIYNKKFSDLFRVGNFIYAVKYPVAGLSHFGDLLFAMMNPNRLFEGRSALAESPRSASDIATTNKRALDRARTLLNIGGLDYMKACFECAIQEADGKKPVLIVLGEQLNGRDVNLESYDCGEFITCSNRKGNVHQYITNQTAERSHVPVDIDIFHINMKAFEDAQVDSKDLEKLVKIYDLSLAVKRPLMIHCTDGLDRSGGLALAYQLFHNWGRVFTSLTATEIVANILQEHEAMQQQRGPSFCTASSKRLHGAVLLASIMKAIQKSKEMIQRNEALPSNFLKKDFLQQIYFLKDKASLEYSELLKLLKARLRLEKLYFEEFASEICHPQIDLYFVNSVLNKELSSLSNTEKDGLIQRFDLVKMEYINHGFNSQSIMSLESLKCDVETFLINYKINKELPTISNNSEAETIKAKISKIETSKDSENEIVNKNIKLKRKKIVFLEIQALKMYASIEEKIEKNSDLATHTTVSEYHSLKKSLTQKSREALLLKDPNVKKIQAIIHKLDLLDKNISVLKRPELDASNDGSKKNRAGSLRLSPRGSRASLLFGRNDSTQDAPPPAITAPEEEANSTSPRRRFTGIFTSPPRSRHGSTRQEKQPDEDAKTTTDESGQFSTGDPATSQTSVLATSLNKLLKKVSPRGSRRGSKMMNQPNMDDSQLNTSAVREDEQPTTPVVETEEFKKALAGLAAERGVTDRVERTNETSPRVGRKPTAPPVDNRRKSHAADEDFDDIGDQITSDLGDLGY